MNLTNTVSLTCRL